MSKKCINCGTILEDDALFCDECGAEQKTIQQPKIGNQQQKQYNMQNQQTNYQNTSFNNAYSANQAIVLKNSGFGIASLILGIIAALTFGCIIIPEILGFVFGIIAICDKKSKNDFAIAGVVLSAIALLFFIIIICV